MKRRVRLTDEIHAEIVKGYEVGRSLDSIAQEVGMGRCRVRTIINKSGRKIRTAFEATVIKTIICVSCDRLTVKRSMRATHCEPCSPIYRKAYHTVANHYRAIFDPHFKWGESLRCYKGMKFYDGWNPKKGGSFEVAANWIVKYLDRNVTRNHHLHIMNRKLGFVPENLCWVPSEFHKQEEMISKVLLENQKLKQLLAQYVGKKEGGLNADTIFSTGLPQSAIRP
jgi:hypothetical protein